MKTRYRIGLMGAHRTGKTTLASSMAKRLSLTHIASSASQVFDTLGLDPRHDYDLATRLTVQRQIIDQFQTAIEAQRGNAVGYISDRTPLDFLAYTLADVGREPLEPALETDLMDYMAACVEQVNDVFDQLILVQPGIPLVDVPGKAPANAPYIEHLNRLLRGFVQEPTLTVPMQIIDRSILDIDAREYFVYCCLLDTIYPPDPFDEENVSELSDVELMLCLHARKKQALSPEELTQGIGVGWERLCHYEFYEGGIPRSVIVGAVDFLREQGVEGAELLLARFDTRSPK